MAEPASIAVVRGVLNGAIGDRLHGRGSRLAMPLTVQPAIEDAEHACLFAHGLMGTAHDWSRRVGGERVSIPAALATAFGVQPLFVTYNSGRHVSENGRALAAALQSACEAAPQLRELSIVAHSMGGLVMRSACHYGLAAGHSWVSMLRRVFLLGVPSVGAPLEQLVHVTAFTLEAIANPWTRWIGKAINLRSAGIKDLRHGFVLDEDWRHRDPDVLRLAAPRRPAEVQGVRWYAAVGSLGPSGSVLGKVLGDGMVRTTSAHGRGWFTARDGVLPDVATRVFDQTSHGGLLTSRAVADQIVAWWDAPSYDDPTAK